MTLDWIPIHGEGGSLPAEGVPVLVRTEADPTRHCHVAVRFAGLWRLSGAQERIVYGVSDWAVIHED